MLASFTTSIRFEIILPCKIMARPPTNTRSFQKKSKSITNVDPDRNFFLPLYILVSVEHFFTAVFGEESGLGQVLTTGGTNTCQRRLQFNLLRQYGSAYEVEIDCGNLNHRRCAWTSPGGMKEGSDQHHCDSCWTSSGPKVPSDSRIYSGFRNWVSESE